MVAATYMCRLQSGTKSVLESLEGLQMHNYIAYIILDIASQNAWSKDYRATMSKCSYHAYTFATFLPTYSTIA